MYTIKQAEEILKAQPTESKPKPTVNKRKSWKETTEGTDYDYSSAKKNASSWISDNDSAKYPSDFIDDTGGSRSHSEFGSFKSDMIKVMQKLADSTNIDAKAAEDEIDNFRITPSIKMLDKMVPEIVEVARAAKAKFDAQKKSSTATSKGKPATSASVPANAFKGIKLNKDEKKSAFSIANKFLAGKKDFDREDVGDALEDDETFLETDEDTWSDLCERLYTTTHKLWEKKNGIKPKKETGPKNYSGKDAWDIIKSKLSKKYKNSTPIAIVAHHPGEDDHSFTVITRTDRDTFKAISGVHIDDKGELNLDYSYSSAGYGSIRQAMNYAETGKSNARYRDKSKQIPDSAYYAPEGGYFETNYLNKQK